QELTSGAAGMEKKALRYLAGFGNEYATEAVPGALPVGQNAPQRPPCGLYTEQISGTPFPAPRAENRRSWLYRIRPSAMHPPFRRMDNGLVRSAPFDEVAPPPNRLRWNPLPFPDGPADFIDGLVTMGGNGDASGRHGVAIHIYRATKPMEHRFLYDADGELLIVPQIGRLRLAPELGGGAGKPRRDCGDPARHQVPRRAAGRTRERLCLRELRRALQAARIGPDRRQRPRQSARFPLPGRRLRRPRRALRGDRQIRGEFVGDRARPFA